MATPKRIKYKGQIYEAVEESNNPNHWKEWNKNAGYYFPNGTYKPKIDTQTGAIILPKEIYDMWN